MTNRICQAGLVTHLTLGASQVNLIGWANSTFLHLQVVNCWSQSLLHSVESSWNFPKSVRWCHSKEPLLESRIASCIILALHSCLFSQLCRSVVLCFPSLCYDAVDYYYLFSVKGNFCCYRSFCHFWFFVALISFPWLSVSNAFEFL